MTNLGSNALGPLSSALNINSNLTHTGSQVLSSSTGNLASNVLSPVQAKAVPTISSLACLNQSLYQPYYTMLIDDETITANLERMRDDFLAKLKQVEFKHKSEMFTYQKLVHQEIKEKAYIKYFTLKQRELQPDKNKYEKAVEAIPRIKMLGDTSKEMQRNLIIERRNQLERRKGFYNNVLA
jgi:hypothetical protein